MTLRPNSIAYESVYDKESEFASGVRIIDTETKEKHFFKASTVRKLELTGPYMHNGVYENLEEVVEFYKVGGGQGMGLDVPYQTLPPDSLHLTTTESKAIIAFMKTLTDKRFEKEAIN